MAAEQVEAKQLYDKLISKGADPGEAAKFSGYRPPSTDSGTAEPSKIERAKEPVPPVAKRQIPSLRIPMDTTKAQRIIFGVMVGVTALTIIGDITSGKAQATDSIPRRMVAGTLAGIMLMLLAIPAPKLAAYIAGLTAVVVLFVNPAGATVITGISNAKVPTQPKNNTAIGGPNRPV